VLVVVVLVVPLAMTCQIRVDHASGTIRQAHVPYHSQGGAYVVENAGDPLAVVRPTSYPGDGFIGRIPKLGSHVEYFQMTLVQRDLGLVIYHLRVAW
jgi:hypothetical protein